MGKVTDGSRDVLNTLLFWTLILATLGLLFLVTGLPVIRQRHTLDVMVEQMTARNVVLYDQVDRLDRQRVALVNDPFYIEKLARRRLNMCRPGETQFTITPTTYDGHRLSAERHISGADPVGLWRLYGSLGAIAEDRMLRRAALVLSALTGIGALVLFGRGVRRRSV
ncbi:MAG TPA: septum formation initiator family protein [Planctomycetota bacterium]|nr:septum formation initiator family protein [Planctomycetota bacterium]